MTYRLTIATPEARTLVVEALRAGADVRARAARKLSANVMADKAEGRDARSGAVKVTTLLNQADQLEQIAAELEAAEEVAVLSLVEPADLAPVVPPGTEAGAVKLTGIEDDGTSPEAQRLAELAGLEPADPDKPAPVEDPVTNELPEDRAGEVVDVTTLPGLDAEEPANA